MNMRRDQEVIRSSVSYKQSRILPHRSPWRHARLHSGGEISVCQSIVCLAASTSYPTIEVIDDNFRSIS